MTNKCSKCVNVAVDKKQHVYHVTASH